MLNFNIPDNAPTIYTGTRFKLQPNYKRWEETVGIADANRRFNTIEQPLPSTESVFQKQKRLFEYIPAAALIQYRGQFVAACNGVIVDSDSNLPALSRRFVETYGHVPVYITKVGEKIRVHIPTPFLR
ncbi:MAG: hypothetical protein AB1757_11850 [Acidobacteriota bacterium]